MRPYFLIPALLAVPLSAALLPPCLKSPRKMTLDGLHACQDKGLLKFIREARLKGRSPSTMEFDAIEQEQRAEARALLANPKLLATESSERAESPKDASESQAAVPAGNPPPLAQPGRLGGVKAGDLARVDRKTAAAISSLQTRLHAAAGKGENGITEPMAADIRATLLAAQGTLSPEMSELLEAVSRDGGKLTPATMKLLQQSGRSAQGEGIDLNIDPRVEKMLLQSDFSKDRTEPPGSM